jgi:hypothetical protein
MKLILLCILIFCFSGDQVVMYTDLNYRHPVTDVDYHPRDHMIAMCSIGENQPIIIYNYNPHSKSCDNIYVEGDCSHDHVMIYM